ncbi:DUF4157 domain-containing protein [Sorangium sp. So ce260]|uniref:eCIS core domain-containing protein n=1 Tax=Sorangium sp. So ce260 TaxID=3133291 RepID=UPI003F5FDCDC
MEAAQRKTVNRSPAPAPGPAAHPVASAAAGPVQLQGAVRVSSPRDPAEREADATAKKILRMPAPEAAAGAGEPGLRGGVGTLARRLESPWIARFADSARLIREHGAAPTIARKGDGPPAVAPAVAAEIASSKAAGQPLPAGVRGFMETRFRADFSHVRVHTGDGAARLNRQLSAQAFTSGSHIFFGRDRWRPETAEGRELLAHELTHTIQQGAAVQRGEVQRSEDATVSERSSSDVQRLGISDALDYFADRANNIPGFRMFTIVLGVNPINMSRVDRSAANILRAVVEFIPGGGLITRALDNHGVFDRVGAWVEQQIRSLGMTGRMIRDAIDRFLDSLSWRDIFDLGGVWRRAVRIFSEPIDRIISFAGGLITGILGFIKDAILRPLAGLASRTRGWDLLCAVLGQNPITGEAVPRTAETLIGGFMRLIGQEEIWQNIQRANAIPRAWAWFQGALAGLMGFVRQIPGLFLQALRALEIADLVLLPRAFARVASVFGGFIGEFLSWAGETIWNLLEIIFAVVAPGVMGYLRRAAAAFRTILRNPIGFVGNLVRAGLLGLRQFAGRFLTHLRASLIGWLTGAMSGAAIYIPQAFTLREILKFVLSVLGLTWQNVRQKLVRAVGEPAVRAMETGFDIVVTLVTQGPAAAWERIQESLANLREMVMEQIMTFVRDRVVQAAITRLVTSLNPAGAFIQAIIAIYNTVMFFVERLRQIAQVAGAFIDSISAIASGALAAAANRVEQTMAGLLTLVISFLARIAGLGRVSDAVTGVVNRVRQPIDRALDRVVDWIVAQARRLGRFVAQAGVPQDPNERLRLAVQAAVAAARRLRQGATRPLLNGILAGIKLRYGLQDLEPYERAGTWWVRATINPTVNQDLEVSSAGQAPAAQGAGTLRALAAPQRAVLREVPAPVGREAAAASSGVALYQGGAGAPAQVVQAILASHREARFDRDSGVLTLPSVSDALVRGAGSLREMAAAVGRATGVSRVVFTRLERGFRLDGVINPVIEGLASYSVGAGRPLQPLLTDLQVVIGRVQPNRDVLVALLRERANAHNVDVTFDDVRIVDSRSSPTVTLVGFRTRTPPIDTFTTEIVITLQNTDCASCGAAASVSQPHNVVNAAVWRDVIPAVASRAPFGLAAADPLVERMTRAGTDTGFGMAMDARGESRMASASTSGASPRRGRVPDRQCAACERLQDRNMLGPPYAGSPATLMHRRAARDAGIPVGAGVSHQAYEGHQFQHLTRAQVEQLTRDKIADVVDQLRHICMDADPPHPIAAWSGATMERFLREVSSEAWTRASAAILPASYPR